MLRNYNKWIKRNGNDMINDMCVRRIIRGIREVIMNDVIDCIDMMCDVCEKEI